MCILFKWIITHKISLIPLVEIPMVCILYIILVVISYSSHYIIFVDTHYPCLINRSVSQLVYTNQSCDCRRSHKILATLSLLARTVNLYICKYQTTKHSISFQFYCNRKNRGKENLHLFITYLLMILSLSPSGWLISKHSGS